MKDIPKAHQALRNLGKQDLADTIAPVFAANGDQKTKALTELKTRGKVWEEVFKNDKIFEALQHLANHRTAMAKVKNTAQADGSSREPKTFDVTQPGVLAMVQTSSHWRGADKGKWKKSMLPLAIAVLIEHAQARQAHALWMGPTIMAFRQAIVQAAKRPTMTWTFGLWDLIQASPEDLTREDPEWVTSGPPPQRANRTAVTHVVAQLLKKGKSASQAAIDVDAPQTGADGQPEIVDVDADDVALGSQGKGKGKGVGHVEEHLKGFQKALTAVSKQTWAKAITSSDIRKVDKMAKGLDRMLYDALAYSWKVS